MQTDHRPLVSLLGSKPLEAIDNRRLVGFRERTFQRQFEIHWVPGSRIPAPDAMSRHPVVGAMDAGESSVVAASQAVAAESACVN